MRGWWLTALALLACDGADVQAPSPSGAGAPSAPAAPSPSGAGAPPVPAPATSSPSGTGAPSASGSADREDSARIVFAIDGVEKKSLSKRELSEAIASETFTSFDPYYGKNKRFRALPLAPVLELGLGQKAAELADRHFVLKAKDGYTVPIEGSQLLEDGGYLAIEDTEHPGWEPIGPQQANPRPFYLVWRKEEQRDEHVYPRPWQLARIEIARFDDTFPKTVPSGEPPGSAAMRGFALFREQCIRCHSINRQGGRVGPDLNVPQSIVEYRPREQIRAYIQNPAAFRYGNMPSNPHLSPVDLDDLLAYFEAMAKRKQDPAAGGHGAP